MDDLIKSFGAVSIVGYQGTLTQRTMEPRFSGVTQSQPLFSARTGQSFGRIGQPFDSVELSSRKADQHFRKADQHFCQAQLYFCHAQLQFCAAEQNFYQAEQHFNKAEQHFNRAEQIFKQISPQAHWGSPLEGNLTSSFSLRIGLQFEAAPPASAGSTPTAVAAAVLGGSITQMQGGYQQQWLQCWTQQMQQSQDEHRQRIQQLRDGREPRVQQWRDEWAVKREEHLQWYSSCPIRGCSIMGYTGSTPAAATTAYSGGYNTLPTDGDWRRLQQRAHQLHDKVRQRSHQVSELMAKTDMELQRLYGGFAIGSSSTTLASIGSTPTVATAAYSGGCNAQIQADQQWQQRKQQQQEEHEQWRQQSSERHEQRIKQAQEEHEQRMQQFRERHEQWMQQFRERNKPWTGQSEEKPRKYDLYPPPAKPN